MEAGLSAMPAFNFFSLTLVQPSMSRCALVALGNFSQHARQDLPGPCDLDASLRDRSVHFRMFPNGTSFADPPIVIWR